MCVGLSTACRTPSLYLSPGGGETEAGLAHALVVGGAAPALLGLAYGFFDLLGELG